MFCRSVRRGFMFLPRYAVVTKTPIPVWTEVVSQPRVFRVSREYHCDVLGSVTVFKARDPKMETEWMGARKTIL